MIPAYNAIAFAFIALAALWGIHGNNRSGTASSRGWACAIDDNPIGFCLIVSTKAAIFGFSIAEILHSFGLVGDPIASIRHALPWLP
jgi:hypothetical protein